MEANTHAICFELPADIWKYVTRMSYLTPQAVVTPRPGATTGGLAWLQAFKFPSITTPGGPRSQTLQPDLAAGLFESMYLEVSASFRPSTSPQHDPPAVESTDQAPEHAYTALKEGLATITHPDGWIGGANTPALRTNMLVNTEWVATYRDFKRYRIAILEKMSAELRSFLAGAPFDMNGMPVYVTKSVELRFEVDFMDMKLLYLQAFVYWRKGGLKSVASILKSIKTNQDCLESQGKRQQEDVKGK